MTPVFSKQISEGGIAYYRCGQRENPSVLLIHGVGLCAESWFPLIDPLTEHFDVVAIDLPGHGKSHPLASDFNTVGLSDYLDVIDQFVRSIDLQNYFVCGHSLGALLATELAAKDSNGVLGLAALNTVYQRDDKASIAVKKRAAKLSSSDSIIGVSQTIERWFTDSPPSNMLNYARLCEHWLRENTVAGYSMAYKAFADQAGPSTENVKQLRCNSVFMTGELDLNSSPEMSSLLKTHARACKATAVVVSGAGHMMPLTHWNKVLTELHGLKQQVLEPQAVKPISQLTLETTKIK